MPAEDNIPKHVAIIMDGNGRWAKERGLPKMAGHRQGVKAANEAIEAAREIGITYLTFYTFSTENWKRPRREVDALFGLLEEYLNKEEEKLIKNNIRLSVLGRLEELPDTTKRRLKVAIDRTRNNTGTYLNLALNYGARAEIVDAVRALAQDAKDGTLAVADITEEEISRRLYTKDFPDPDLLIRTSGEMRISNFLLWQISYTELYIMKKLWPDFKKADLKKAVAEYQSRARRYGG